VAARDGRLGVVKELIKKGVDVDATWNQSTALAYAAKEVRHGAHKRFALAFTLSLAFTLAKPLLLCYSISFLSYEDRKWKEMLNVEMMT